ncbi:MAG: hypothetical protein J6K17_00055 [Oscillospiraceae bacterium]|nr:hypothetical protein [Oscillospiraceae bacterium]
MLNAVCIVAKLYPRGIGIVTSAEKKQKGMKRMEVLMPYMIGFISGMCSGIATMKMIVNEGKKHENMGNTKHNNKDFFKK